MQIVIEVDKMPMPGDEIRFYCNQDGELFAGREPKYCKKVVVAKPKERIGEWINIINQDLHDYRTGNKLCFECSKCKSQFTYSSNYCPICGIRMEERSDKG